jgi:hypothetical protein
MAERMAEDAIIPSMPLRLKRREQDALSQRSQDGPRTMFAERFGVLTSTFLIVGQNGANWVGNRGATGETTLDRVQLWQI